MGETILGVASLVGQWCALVGAVLCLLGWWQPPPQTLAALTLVALSAAWGARAKIAMDKREKAE